MTPLLSLMLVVTCSLLVLAALASLTICCLKLVKLVDKLAAIISSKDPLSFQAIQAMTPGVETEVFDPGNEAEYSRVHDREGIDDEADNPYGYDWRESVDGFSRQTAD
jgi:hypothetical protein